MIDYKNVVKDIDLIIKQQQIIWFYSKDFKETKVFTNCEELDRYCKSEYMMMAGEKVLYRKGHIIGITNNIDDVEKTSSIFFDKTIEMQSITEKVDQGCNHMFSKINFYFMPQIENIRIEFEYNE